MTYPVRITHIGTATTLLEIGTLRLVTDPAFDGPGGHYHFGFGTRSTKLDDTRAAAALGPCDAVLLSHDQHADNLDEAGRAYLAQAKTVLTTVAGQRRLGGHAVGLAPFAATTLTGPAGEVVRVTATPARHGPAIITRLFVGQVTGFMLEWEGQRGPLYISGDTRWFAGIRKIAARWRVDTAILHMGDVGFRLTGPFRYTFDAREAVLAAQALGARVILPVHYDGWSHFLEGRDQASAVFARAGLAERVRWLERGVATTLDL